MKQFGTVITMVWVVTLLFGGTHSLWGQDVEQQQVVTRIDDPDAEGVYPFIGHNNDITIFLKNLSTNAHKNIIPSPQVRGLVTFTLYDVTYKEALDAVLPVNGFAYEEKGSFIYVYTKKELEDLKAAARQMETRMFPLNYIMDFWVFSIGAKPTEC